MINRISLVICLSIILLISIIGISNFQNKKTTKLIVESKPISNMFLPINGSYSLGEGEVTPLNLTYIYSIDKKDLFNKIDTIYLSNENSISVESFVVNGNAKVGKYYVKTLALNIIGVSKGKTEINEITIQTKSGLKEYDIGSLGINVVQGTSEKPLVEGNMYPVLRDENDNYLYSLQNIGSNKIVINNFDAELNGEQIFNTEPIIIDPNVQKEEEVPIKVDFQKSPYAVTVIRPSIYYSDGDEKRVFLPPPTWYGLMGITQEQIEKTIEYIN